ncbi:MAG TPA: cyclic nucleotide-binding domain-containing protein, partial [Povalibacter sp.]|nr:cyclic nucleotide-binding domain-containing protein [Povalibacter sp.]
MATELETGPARTLYETRRPQMFPQLTAAQIARLAAHGHEVDVSAGEVLVEPGRRSSRFMVVLSGSLDVSLSGTPERQITVLTPGEFAGELSTLRGLNAFVHIRVIEAGRVLVLDEEQLRNVVQTDAELSEIFMRA